MSNRPVIDGDKRRSPRRTVSWRARVLRPNGDIVECRTLDNSAGGAGLISQVPVPVGERVRVALQVSDERTGAMSVVVREAVVVLSVLTPNGFRLGLQSSDPLRELLDEIPAES